MCSRKALPLSSISSFVIVLLLSSVVSLFLLIGTLNTLSFNFLKDFQNLPTAQKAVYKEFLMELKDWIFFFF